MQLSSQCLLILISPLIFQAMASSASLANLTRSPDSADSFNNTNLGAVVPSSFTIQPSSPGSRLGPNQGFAKTEVLEQTVLAFQTLVLEDFNAETIPRSFDHPWFDINIDGPTLEPKSNLLYKHAIWGLYSAIWYMLSNSFYREVTFKLLWEESLVGQIRFVKRDSSTSGNNNNKSIEMNNLLTALPNTNSTLLDITATKVTSSSALSIIYRNGHVTAEIDMAGRPLPLADVYMTVFTAFVELAPKPRTQIVRAFSANRDYYIWLQVNDPSTPPRRRAPFMIIEVLVWALGNIPNAMALSGNNWREMQMTIRIDSSVVGRGSMVADSLAPLVLADSYILNVTTL